MRKILMGSVASIALLGFAAGFPQPTLGQSDAPAATAQGQATPDGDTKAQGNMPASSQGDATQSSGTTATTTAGAEGASSVDTAPPEEMRYRSVGSVDAGSITLPNEMTTDEIVGASVYDTKGDDIGDVADLLLDDSGQVNMVLVDVGGFLGMGEHRVALDLDQVQFADVDGALRAEVDVTKEQLEAMPSYERADDDYWVAGPVTSPAMPAASTQAAATNEPTMSDTEYRTWDQAGDADMKLGDMSAKDVLGATVYGSDGNDIGKVADLQIGPNNTIDRMIVDVGGFLGMGVHTVALPVDQTEMAMVDGEERITVAATKDELKAMPEYEQDSEGNWVVND